MPSERLQRLRRNLDSIPWNEIGQDARESILRNFDVGGRPKKWPKRKINRPWPILNRKGSLKNAHYVNPIKDGVIIGNRKVYAAVHNYSYPPRNIPQRKYLMIPPGDAIGIKRKIKKHLVSGTK